MNREEFTRKAAQKYLYEDDSYEEEMDVDVEDDGEEVDVDVEEEELDPVDSAIHNFINGNLEDFRGQVGNSGDFARVLQKAMENEDMDTLMGMVNLMAKH